VRSAHNPSHITSLLGTAKAFVAAVRILKPTVKTRVGPISTFCVAAPLVGTLGQIAAIGGKKTLAFKTG
jgi:hypothetical protein